MFSFMNHISVSKKFLPSWKPWGLLPRFVSRRFVILTLTFISMTYFELSFVYNVREGSKFSFLYR